ncbi:MAG: hypothetical protein KDG50_03305 [Chromatiales bacterium]|nr:hypothetical protein [Chromatiales bacterium]
MNPSDRLPDASPANRRAIAEAAEAKAAVPDALHWQRLSRGLHALATAVCDLEARAESFNRTVAALDWISPETRAKIFKDARRELRRKSEAFKRSLREFERRLG